MSASNTTPVVIDDHVHPPTTHSTTPTPRHRAILTISLSKHLVGHPIAEVIERDWTAKATPAQHALFDNQGFDFDPTHEAASLASLRDVLQGARWHGVIVGWCSRGNKAFTALFEQIVGVCVREVVRRTPRTGEAEEEQMKLMFSEGPEDLVRTTLRGFGGAEGDGGGK